MIQFSMSLLVLLSLILGSGVVFNLLLVRSRFESLFISVMAVYFSCAMLLILLSSAHAFFLLTDTAYSDSWLYAGIKTSLRAIQSGLLFLILLLTRIVKGKDLLFIHLWPYFLWTLVSFGCTLSLVFTPDPSIWFLLLMNVPGFLLLFFTLGLLLSKQSERPEEGALEIRRVLPFLFGFIPFAFPFLTFTLLAALLYFLFLAVLALYFVRSEFKAKYSVKTMPVLHWKREWNISDREAEIIRLVIQGLKNREIGEQLYISEKTVNNHLYSIYKKTGVGTRLALYQFLKNAK